MGLMSLFRRNSCNLSRVNFKVKCEKPNPFAYSRHFCPFPVFSASPSLAQPSAQPSALPSACEKYQGEAIGLLSHNQKIYFFNLDQC